jgi:hypothetical protein
MRCRPVLFQHLAVGVVINPPAPLGAHRSDARQKPVQVFSTNPAQPSPYRIPEAQCLFVVQDKGPPVGPSGRSEGQGPAIQGTAVHSRQVRQGSVAHSNGVSRDGGIGNLMVYQTVN